ncbi:hypothetical protein PSHI_12910 [Pseudomonas sp. URMO17WK12:I11]|nr:hypothetical protein PSHI_12910 [Pseudomonas sp. URMO17WK12:I11]
MIAEFKGLIASKLAMAVKQSPQTQARDYRSRIASVRAFNTGLSR